MSCEVKTVEEFDREFKRLAKKHRSLVDDLIQLIEELQADPKLGVHLGGSIYKIRLRISGKGKGKSGGGRVITYVHSTTGRNEQTTVYLLGIFDKSAIDAVPVIYYRSILEALDLGEA